MLIENPDALRGWLTTTLEPICDADPAALAKYVMALLKKDKQEQELRDFCIDQLDVFLQKETRNFVDLLFGSIADKSYINGTQKGNKKAQPAITVVTAAPSTAVASSKPAGQSDRERPPLHQQQQQQQSQSSSSSRRLRSSGGEKDSLPVPAASDATSSGRTGSYSVRDRLGERPATTSSSRSERTRRVHSKEKEERGSRRTSRSRSRSGERGRTAVATVDERISTKTKSGRWHSSKRKHAQAAEGNSAVGVKRSSPSSLKVAKVEPALPSVSTVEHRHKIQSRSRSNSKSKSPLSNRQSSVSRKLSPGLQLSGEEGKRSDAEGKLEPDKRTSIRHATLQSATGPRLHARRLRCRDYDEKGFCLRGDLCPYDHGPDPVVVEEMSLPSMIAIAPGASGPPPSLRAPPPPPNLSVPPPGYVHQHPPPPGVEMDQYNPEAPGLSTPIVSAGVTGVAVLPGTSVVSKPLPAAGSVVWSQPPTILSAPSQPPIVLPPFPPPPALLPPMLTAPNSVSSAPQRQLITLAAPDTHDQRGKRSAGTELSLSIPIKRAYAQPSPDQCTLEVRKIPPYLNNIFKLNKHFSQFGNVVNIQVKYGGDESAAIVQYSSHSEANLAFKSTTPIFNNRFIRVFWFNQLSSTAPSAYERLGVTSSDDGVAYAADTSMVQPKPQPVEDEEGNRQQVMLTTRGSLTKTVYNPVALKQQAALRNTRASSNEGKATSQTDSEQEAAELKIEQQQLQQYAAVLQAKKDSKRIKIAQQMALEVRKRKAKLFEQQLQQQKLLISQLEKCQQKTKKNQIIQTIKELEKSISALREELNQPLNLPMPKLPTTKQQLERKVLDCELQLMRDIDQGKDISQLQETLDSLKQQLEAVPPDLIGGPMTSTPIQPNNNVITPAKPVTRKPVGSRYIPPSANLDLRPRDIIVAGFSLLEATKIVDHFKQYGPIEKFDLDEETMRLFIKYKTRKDAETAVNSGASAINSAQNDSRASVDSDGLPASSDAATAAGGAVVSPLLVVEWASEAGRREKQRMSESGTGGSADAKDLDSSSQSTDRQLSARDILASLGDLDYDEELSNEEEVLGSEEDD